MPLCSAWGLADDCVDIPDGTEQAVIDHWNLVASELLWAASGRQIGTCEVAIRPCLDSCGPWMGWYPDGFPMFPYRDSGGWHNFCGCFAECSCTSLCTIVLPGPVASITEILIGGDSLEDTNYRVDLLNGRYELIRTDSGCWPACQDMKLDTTEENTFAVTYELGIVPDDLAIAAVTELTSELVKACDETCKTCRLPKNAVAVTRRGVTLTFDNSKTWLRILPMVSSFLDAVNPAGLTSASQVHSPDLPSYRQTLAPPVS